MDPNPREVSVTLHFALNIDGTVNGTPAVLEFPASQYEQVAAENAVRAVLKCGPYSLPKEEYDQSSEVELQFTPEPPHAAASVSGDAGTPEKAILYEEPAGGDSPGQSVTSVEASVTWSFVQDGPNGPEVGS